MARTYAVIIPRATRAGLSGRPRRLRRRNTEMATPAARAIQIHGSTMKSASP
jgi:hypothetical protein